MSHDRSLFVSLSLSYTCLNAFSGTEVGYRMIKCESVLGSTNAIRSLPLKVLSSVPNPTGVVPFQIVHLAPQKFILVP